VARPPAGVAVQLDQRREGSRIAADDRDHERQTQRAGADERGPRAPHANPDGQRVLQGPGVDALAGERGAVPAGPVRVRGGAQLSSSASASSNSRSSSARSSPNSGNASVDDPPDDELGAAAGHQVERGELLEDAHGIGCAEHGHGAAQADPRGAGSGGRQQHDRRRVEVLLTVVLSDPEGVQAHPVGERDLLQQVGDALRRARHLARAGVGDRADEAVDAEVHADLLGGDAGPVSGCWGCRAGRGRRC
jgi:hypothetical protein